LRFRLVHVAACFTEMKVSKLITSSAGTKRLHTGTRKEREHLLYVKEKLSFILKRKRNLIPPVCTIRGKRWLWKENYCISLWSGPVIVNVSSALDTRWTAIFVLMRLKFQISLVACGSQLTNSLSTSLYSFSRKLRRIRTIFFSLPLSFVLSFILSIHLSLQILRTFSMKVPLIVGIVFRIYVWQEFGK
jgi:hypothetical protein